MEASRGIAQSIVQTGVDKTIQQLVDSQAVLRSLITKLQQATCMLKYTMALQHRQAGF